jgi:PAS domain S-box-containing protein
VTASFQGFRSLVENSPDAISLVDRQGEILYGSAATNRLFGYQPAELVGRNCLDLIHPDDLDHSNRALQDVLSSPSGLIQWEARVRRKDDNYSWIENTVYNLLLEAEVQAIVIHQRDVSERKAAEKEKQQYAEELVRSNLRLEEFAYTAAHDLREPLRAISAYVEMLVRKAPMDPEVKKMAGFILDGSARMSTLIADLLSFASTGLHEPPQEVRLQDALAQATQNLVLPLEESGATVTVDWLPMVQGNEIHLVRLFQNLLSNAVKYRRNGQAEIYVSADRREQDWIIRVKDNGLGIASGDQSRVFMPFVRLANRDVPGTGLGLAVCKKIVEGYGGKIWVESEAGIGSTFCFTIPALQENRPAQTTASGNFQLRRIAV